MTEQRKDGGPAFPGEIDNVFVDATGKQAPFTIAARQKGMSLRDYFAAQAMAAFIQRSDDAFGNESRCAQWAYMQADAMLKAREATHD